MKFIQLSHRYRLFHGVILYVFVMLLAIEHVIAAEVPDSVERQSPQAFIAGLAKQRTQLGTQKNVQPAEGAIVFVSFSMPESLLIELSEQAHAYGIPVVVRGLVHNDFKQTLTKLNVLYRYATNNQKSFYGLSIDPLWFEQFDIQAVPALIVTKRPEDCLTQSICPNQPYVLIYGITSIQHALEVIRDKSQPFKGVAEQLLNKGRHHG